MTTPTNTTTPNTPTNTAMYQSRDTGEATLTALALGLAMLLGAMLWGVLNQPAQAEMVTETGHLVAMTARGENEDILFLLDNRTEQIMLYRVAQNNTIELLQSLDLPDLFQSARARRLGGN